MSFLDDIMNKAQELKDDQVVHDNCISVDSLSSSYHSTPDQSIAETVIFTRKAKIEDVTFTRVRKLDDANMEIEVRTYNRYEMPKSPGSQHCSVNSSFAIDVPDYSECVKSATLIQQNLRVMFANKRKKLLMASIKTDV